MHTEHFSRRDFIKYAAFTTAAVTGGGLLLKSWRSSEAVSLFSGQFAGQIVGANQKVGHILRDLHRGGSLPEISHTESIDTVIVGGGIAGLSAAWWLKRHRYERFVLLELDREPGGNSCSAKNEVSAYPWAAHYVPLPPPEAKYVRLLFEELGVIRGYQGHEPIYDEYYLCSDPHERLFFQGAWQDGVIPQNGIASSDRRQYDEFFAHIEKLKTSKGRDGRRPFVIPLDLSSQDSEYTALDRLSMAEFMTQKGWNSRYLNWYVNYCCRDDFGQTHDKVSAWAGLHYFASRVGRGANADTQSVVTWPEGNGWLAKHLARKSASHLRTNSLVYRITPNRHGASVDYFDTETKTSRRLIAKQVIYAAPRFTARHTIAPHEATANASGDAPAFATTQLTYPPWMVANLTLSRKPAGYGQQLAWDNVSFYSPSLGYIVATHQNVNRDQLKTVITYYLPLSDLPPDRARKEASQRDHTYWATLIAQDLEKMHPGISRDIENIDVWLWGHGMSSPGIGYIWSEERKRMLESYGPIHFAHSDMSGISLFEEAQYQGVIAAQKVLRSEGTSRTRA